MENQRVLLLISCLRKLTNYQTGKLTLLKKEKAQSTTPNGEKSKSLILISALIDLSGRRYKSKLEYIYLALNAPLKLERCSHLHYQFIGTAKRSKKFLQMTNKFTQQRLLWKQLKVRTLLKFGVKDKPIGMGCRFRI